MDNRPIGVFDSGLGGLTAVDALRGYLPEENIIYFGDNGRCPYGVRPREEIRHMTEQDLEFISSFGCKAYLAACGTISVNAADILAAYLVPVFTVLDPAARAMAATPGDGSLAVIATEASIRCGVFVEKIAALSAPGRELLSIPCQDFVALCENGHTSPNDPLLAEAVERYLAPARAKEVSAMLLGCTHFGIIEDAIRGFMGNRTMLVSASECAAFAVAEYIKTNGLNGTGGKTALYTSGSTEEFDRMAKLILKEEFTVPSIHVAPREI